MEIRNRILVVDDETELLVSCKKLLGKMGYEVITASSAATALAALEEQEFDLILCDLQLPDIDGMEVLARIKKSQQEVPVVMISGYGTVERAVEAMKASAFDFVEKPFSSERLRVVVRKALEHRRLYRERRDLLRQLQERYQLDQIVGRSAAMLRIFDMVERIAESGANVTITGESGTGKELIARAIHVRSRRRARPFVPVNCGALPENLFESELFGYEKGAFTGAYRRKPGLLEFAHGGTFFLDEICELPPPLQVKLLRMLQDHKIRRVGGDDLIDVDVRIIAASNQNLEEMVAAGKLREDLYYRLKVISVHLPPLRDRREDIPLLCHHFLEKFLKATPKQIEGFEPEVLRLLERYEWPGNVRELQNVVERAVALAPGPWIRVADLPDNIAGEPGDSAGYMDLPLKEAKEKLLQDFERNYLIRLLRRHRGNVSRAADASGVDRRTLHRLLGRLHLDPHLWKQL